MAKINLGIKAKFASSGADKMMKAHKKSEKIRKVIEKAHKPGAKDSLHNMVWDHRTGKYKRDF